jgi:uncharacterized protein (TIGR03435 family)
MPEPDDIALLKQYAEENSEAAFAGLVTRYVNLVYSAALRSVGNAHAAEEITQAVFIILARKAKSLTGGWQRRLVAVASLSGWLYQTARLTAANYLRTEIRRRNREQEAYMQAILNEPESDPSRRSGAEAEAWRQIAPLLDDAMGRLGEKDRNAIVLRFFENKNMSEVGAALGASEDAAKMRVNRALEKLRKIFAKRGVASTTAIIAGAVSANSVQAAPAVLAKTISAVAIAKGAAASASTLTLIKGALKIMAWTKAKTAIVVGVGVLLTAGVTTVVVKKTVSSSPDSIYEEIWKHPDSSSSEALEKAPPILIIRDARYPNKMGGIWTTSGKGVWDNGDIADLIGFAYHFGSTRMILPDGLPSGRFDYLNTLPRGSQDGALREELKKQFGLIAHTETRETDVMLLKINDSPKLQSHLSKGGHTSNYGTGNNKIQRRIFRNVELSAITSLVEGFYLKPTLDRTGMSRHYDFDIQWTEQKWSSPEARMSTIQQALLNQLDQFGLELVPSREPVELLVVEKSK